MTHVIRETVNKNRKRLWGSFKLSDKSITKFEMLKGESWFQWNNSTENLCLTSKRVEQLAQQWLEEYV